MTRFSRNVLAEVVEELAHLLPAQGPISVFIHHNPLHALEHLPFEDAVVDAARRLGCEPFLPEARYRTNKIPRGRITPVDVESVLAEELGERGGDEIAAGIRRAELERRIVLGGIPEARGSSLVWLLAEAGGLEGWRDDLPDDARAALATDTPASLHAACLRAIARASPAPARAAERAPPCRHADVVRIACGIDVDQRVDAVLIPFVAAYLDQGLARWPMPGRERGMLACFAELYGSGATALAGAWSAELRRLLAREPAADGLESLARSLDALGVAEGELRELVTGTALALRGWAGMVRQLERRPDRVPATELPARLADLLAVRLLVERAVLADVAQDALGHPVPLAALRAELRPRLPAPSAPSGAERAWSLYHLAQLAGLDTRALDALDGSAVDALELVLGETDSLARRRVLHLAYERHHRHRVYDALAQHAPEQPPRAPAFQAIFCIDEREESFRRHLEEVEPDSETLRRGGVLRRRDVLHGARPTRTRAPCARSRCSREHDVAEVASSEAAARRSRACSGAALGSSARALALGQPHGRCAGAIALHARRDRDRAAGAAGALPVARRSACRSAARRPSTPPHAARDRSRPERRAARRRALRLHRRGDGRDRRALSSRTSGSAGASRRWCSSSATARRASTTRTSRRTTAARAAAAAAARTRARSRRWRTTPRVRDRARDARRRHRRRNVVRRRRAQHRATTPSTSSTSTASRTPCAPRFERAAEALRSTRARATRTSAAAASNRSPRGSRRWPRSLHVEARAADLAQPRPEYGHATNAFCVVGRRARTRGLFLDRRAFLVSYDPDARP